MNIRRKLTEIGSAGLGQALNFIAMILPILGQQAQQIAYLAFPLALAVVLARSSTLAYHVRYLNIHDEERGTATGVALMGLTSMTVFVSLVAILLTAQHLALGQLLLWTSALIFAHGIYFMGVAATIREEKMALYGKLRLYYGIVNIISTVCVVYIWPTIFGLVIATAITTFTTGIIFFISLRLKVLNSLIDTVKTLKTPKITGYIHHSLSTTSATLLSDLTFQMQALLTPLMGPYRELWAIIIRLTGGFGTVGQQVIAPYFESSISKHIRGKKLNEAQRLIWRSVIFGVVFSLTGTVATFVVTWLISPELIGSEPLPIVLFFGSAFLILSNALTTKIPYIIGRQRLMIIWSFGKLLSSVPLFVLNSHALIAGLFFVLLASWLLEMLICSWPLDKRNKSKLFALSQ